jgi:hypothetical protein
MAAEQQPLTGEGNLGFLGQIFVLVCQSGERERIQAASLPFRSRSNQRQRYATRYQEAEGIIAPLSVVEATL